MSTSESTGVSAPSRPIRVVLVDDEPLMRAAFRVILEAGSIEVVGEAGDGAQAVRVVLATSPEVVLMDVRMPGVDGLAATAALATRAPAASVLVLTTFDDDAVLFGALDAGAAGFLTKNAPPEEIVRAVRRLAVGDAVLDPTVTRRVLARYAPSRGSNPFGRVDATTGSSLTERERDVWWLMARGLTNSEIAARLAVGEETAKTHVARVLMKLGVRDRVQAVIRAHESGFALEGRALG